MSFILDALKKSESERQRQSAPGLADVPGGGRSHGPSPWVWALALLLAINAIVLLALWLRPTERTVAAAPPRSAVETPPTDDTGSPTFSRLLSEARDSQPSPAERTAPPVPEQSGPRTEDRDEAPARAAGASPQEAGKNLPLPTFAELRANGTLQLPDLHLDIHVYGDKPADRFVFVNMNKYREQGTLAEGPVVKEISSDGVILDHRGTEFLLPRE